MGYKLKEKYEAFQVVDGPFASRRFVPGVEYEEIPPQEKHKFEPARRTAGGSATKRGGQSASTRRKA